MTQEEQIRLYRLMEKLNWFFHQEMHYLNRDIAEKTARECYRRFWILHTIFCGMTCPKRCRISLRMRGETMIEERIPISGDLKSKVKQLMEYAGWQEGRKVDISIAEKYYADHGVPMMKTTQRFYRKYFGLCCEWYLEQKKLNWAADFQFALFPYLVNGIKNHLEEAYFRDMSGCELAEIEQAVGEKCQPIGHIGYYYPAEVWISEYGKLYAKYEYQDEIECFPDVFALIERELRQCKFDSAAMKTVEALDGKR